ncbi:Polyadenylate-binding protein 2 [Linum perenne]
MAQVQAQHQQTAATAGATSMPAQNGVVVAAGPIPFGATSLYVGDLDLNVTEEQIYDLFGQVGPLVSVRICRDQATRRSLGYGYVNYNSSLDAARALELLNFTPLNNRPIRIMYSHRDPSVRKSGAGNIYIKNLDKAIDHKALHDTFSTFGTILSCKVATDASGQSKGYGFVQFDTDEAAKNAIDKLNGMLINDKQVYVGHFVRKQERDSSLSNTRFNNVFVKNLSESTTDEDLKNVFGEYGSITSAVVMRDGDGKSRCFGFVNFENADDAAKAVEALNGKKIDDKEWFVGKAQKKSERELELRGRFEHKYQGLNLYIKNLDDSISDEKLKELFSEFGTVTSCKVVRDPSGISKGSGFVAFATPEEASRAINEMNGRMVVSKPLYVAHAQRKEDRRARLQAQFSQMRPVAMPPTVGPRMPMFPPGAPGLGQQFMYGQGPPAIIPPQAGFGYQQQLVPGMRPGVGPMQNYFVPVVQHGQQGMRPGGRRGGGPGQQSQQPVPMMPQQMFPRGRGYRYPPGRNMPEVPMPGVGGGMLSVPYDMGGMAMREAAAGQPMPITALTSALANASPEDQRTLLGENLYPLVGQLEPDSAAKVTGMLLEMDQTEVLHLLESPEALKAKVAEAMDVLRNVSAAAAHPQANNAADQLASLSLNDGLVP